MITNIIDGKKTHQPEIGDLYRLSSVNNSGKEYDEIIEIIEVHPNQNKWEGKPIMFLTNKVDDEIWHQNLSDFTGMIEGRNGLSLMLITEDKNPEYFL